MRVFGRHAAEIVPHASDDACDLGLRKLGKGAADVAPSMFGDAEKGTNTAGQCTAEGGSEIERQKLEPAEQRRCTPGLQTIGELDWRKAMTAMRITRHPWQAIHRIIVAKAGNRLADGRSSTY